MYSLISDFKLFLGELSFFVVLTKQNSFHKLNEFIKHKHLYSLLITLLFDGYPKTGSIFTIQVNSSI